MPGSKTKFEGCPLDRGAAQPMLGWLTTLPNCTCCALRTYIIIRTFVAVCIDKHAVRKACAYLILMPATLLLAFRNSVNWNHTISQCELQCLSVGYDTSVQTREISVLTIDQLVGTQRFAVVRCADSLFYFCH